MGRPEPETAAQSGKTGSWQGSDRGWGFLRWGIQGIRSSKSWELWGALKPSEYVIEMADSKFWESLERVPPSLLLPPNPSWGIFLSVQRGRSKSEEGPGEAGDREPRGD